MAEQETREGLVEEWSERVVALIRESPLTVGEICALTMGLAMTMLASSAATVEEAEAYFDEAKREMRASWLLPQLADNRAKLINMALDKAEEAQKS